MNESCKKAFFTIFEKTLTLRMNRLVGRSPAERKKYLLLKLRPLLSLSEASNDKLTLLGVEVASAGGF
jgi:hypothetical protein